MEMSPHLQNEDSATPKFAHATRNQINQKRQLEMDRTTILAHAHAHTHAHAHAHAQQPSKHISLSLDLGNALKTFGLDAL